MDFVTEDNITDVAERRWATADSPRLAELMTALVRHVHGFAREVDPTEEEWLGGLEWLTRTGQASTDKRQEFILASDVLGLSMLIVQMNNRFSAAATPATVLGPFHIDGSSTVAFGFDMSDGIEGVPLFVTGRVVNTAGDPLPGVVLDVWQADADGLYESQIAGIDEERLRGRYSTREDGRYCIRTVAPSAYPIPLDGPVGEMISRTKISHFRPAHFHCLIEQDGYERLVTHLFREGADYLDSDVVFGVKSELVVPFVEHEAGSTPDGRTIAWPDLQVEYDFVLEPTRAA